VGGDGNFVSVILSLERRQNNLNEGMNCGMKEIKEIYPVIRCAAGDFVSTSSKQLSSPSGVQKNRKLLCKSLLYSFHL